MHRKFSIQFITIVKHIVRFVFCGLVITELNKNCQLLTLQFFIKHRFVNTKYCGKLQNKSIKLCYSV